MRDYVDFCHKYGYNIDMLHLHVVAVGEIKEKFYRDAIAEYEKRLSRWVSVDITEIDEASKVADINKKMQLEGENLLARAKGFIVLMDINGEKISSVEFAHKLDKIGSNGDSDITFIIGGSNGVSDDVKKGAKLRLSFGEITLPHQLFRVVLLEQIYRAETILHGVSYHK